jgi:hypothetical protein
MRVHDNVDTPYAELFDIFIQSWADLTVQAASAGPKTNTWVSNAPVPQRAYLLLDQWDDNPLAWQLEDQLAKMARDRVPVPDPHFQHNPEYAPFLVELPEALVLGANDAPTQALCMVVREWLVRCFAQAHDQASQRVSRQHFGGIVVSPASEQAIVRYWVELGYQQPLYQSVFERTVFRYQDPRVMQRMWPALHPEQKNLWLGPVTHWWSLLQPWGPFNTSEQLLPRWFQATAPVLPREVKTGGSPRNLFDDAQWLLTGTAHDANMIWRGYADNHIASALQPDARSMLHMLADGRRLGLQGGDLDDYIWATWMHTPNAGAPRAMDWSLPHTAPVLHRILAQLRAQPNAGFAVLLNRIIQTSNKR